jgi:hypothetical protein
MNFGRLNSWKKRNERIFLEYPQDRGISVKDKSLRDFSENSRAQDTSRIFL